MRDLSYVPPLVRSYRLLVVRTDGGAPATNNLFPYSWSGKGAGRLNYPCHNFDTRDLDLTSISIHTG